MYAYSQKNKQKTETLTDSYSILKLHTYNPGRDGMTFGDNTNDSSSAALLLSHDFHAKTVDLNNVIIKTNMHRDTCSIILLK